MSFDQQYLGTASNRAKFYADIPMVNLGLTAVAGKFFAALKMESNLSATSTGTSETDRSLLLESNSLTHPGGAIDVERQDISFTIGYNVWKRLNIFTGKQL